MMQFEGNHELPSLEFYEDEGRIKIWGRSISTAAGEDFWLPLIDKLEDYLLNPIGMIITIDLEYFATSSAKLMLEFFKVLAKNTIDNKQTTFIKWIYEDEDMIEAGEDFESIVPELIWEFIEK